MIRTVHFNDYLPNVCLKEIDQDSTKRSFQLAFNDAYSISQTVEFQLKFQLNVYQICTNYSNNNKSDSFLNGVLVKSIFIEKLNEATLIQNLYLNKYYAFELIPNLNSTHCNENQIYSCPYYTDNSYYCKTCDNKLSYKCEKCLKLVYYFLNKQNELFENSKNSFNCFKTKRFLSFDNYSKSIQNDFQFFYEIPLDYAIRYPTNNIQNLAEIDCNFTIETKTYFISMIITVLSIFACIIVLILFISYFQDYIYS